MSAVAISSAVIEDRVRKAMLAVSLVLNVGLIFFLFVTTAQVRKADAIAGDSLQREHRVVEQAMQLRASSAALALACHDTDAALAICTVRLGTCEQTRKERTQP